MQAVYCSNCRDVKKEDDRLIYVYTPVFIFLAVCLRWSFLEWSTFKREIKIK